MARSWSSIRVRDAIAKMGLLAIVVSSFQVPLSTASTLESGKVSSIASDSPNLTVYGNDSNNNKIEDSLERMSRTSGFVPFPVLIQTTEYKSAIARLEQLGVEAQLVSQTLDQVKAYLSFFQFASITALGEIKLIERDRVFDLIVPPNVEPKDYEFLDGHKSTTVANTDKSLTAAKQRFQATGAGQVIAVVDTGVDSGHSSLDEGKVIHRENFVTSTPSCTATVPTSSANGWDVVGHGTRVA